MEPNWTAGCVFGNGRIPSNAKTADVVSTKERNDYMNTSLLSKTPVTKGPGPKDAKRTRWPLLALAVVALLAGTWWTIASLGGDDAPEAAAGPALVLSLGDDAAMASCIVMDTTILGGMSPAFAATATAAEGEKVTLSVDKWYAGGDAATVELNAQPGQAALIDGFDFEVGEQYLITAANGTVNFCGYSGPASAELTALFEQAFAA